MYSETLDHIHALFLNAWIRTSYTPHVTIGFTMKCKYTDGNGIVRLATMWLSLIKRKWPPISGKFIHPPSLKIRSQYFST